MIAERSIGVGPGYSATDRAGGLFGTDMVLFIVCGVLGQAVHGPDCFSAAQAQVCESNFEQILTHIVRSSGMLQYFSKSFNSSDRLCHGTFT
jgi:hypothetical protein